MNMGHKMTWGTAERLEMALKARPGLATFRDEVGKAKGFPMGYLEALGLTKQDMKRLERSGYALRGYTKNVWTPGETLPNGKEATFTEVGRGHSVRWIILTDRPAEEVKSG